MAKSSLTIGDLLYRLGFENDEEFIKGLEGVLGKAEKEVEKGGREAGKKGGKTAGDAFQQQFKATFSGAALGSFLGTALANAFKGAISAAQRFAVDSVREFAVYEQGLLQLKLAGETNLAALSKRIQDTAKATKVFSATDVSLAVGELVKAGYDAETAFALVETGALGAASEVDAATGKFGDLTGVAGQLGNILRALGLETSESSRVMDVLARAAQDSNLNVSDLVDIVSRVGPTAKLAGLEIEDLAAMAAVLSNNGMEASLIGTGLRSVFQSLINPSGQVKGQLDALGISLVDSNGNLRDFSEVLDGLHELTERGGEGLQLLTQATGSFGSAAAANLGSASEEVKTFRRNMEDAEGTAKELADTMRNSAAGAAAEMAARVADARAALGEQMMPILLSLNETVLPALVTLLGEVIQKWTDWQFIITGTTTAIRQADEAMRQSVLTNLGDDLGGLILQRTELLQRVSDLQSQLANWDRSTDWLGLGKGRAERELADLQFQLAGVNSEIKALTAQRELARRQGLWGDGSAAFGPLGEGQERPQAVVEAANEVAAAYRNLQTVEAELAEARSKWAAAGSADEETRWAAEVKRLEAEKRAKEAAVKTAEAAAKSVSATVTKDPLVDEARRVQADLQRLKLAYEQGKLDLDDYVAAQEAHLRRLDGLYERASSPEQSLAVLRARKVFLDELSRLAKEQADADAKAATESEAALQRIVDAWQEYADGRKAAQAAIDDAAAERAAKREEHAMLKVVNAWKAYAQSLKDAQALQDAAAARDAARDARREETALRRVVEAHNEYTASLKEAIRLQEERDTRRAGHAAAKEAAELLRVAEAHRQYTDSLKEAARIEAERAAAQARAAQVAGTRRVVADQYPGYAGNAASSYTTLADRASGSLVRLAQAQRTLGVATRDDVQAALEGQIAAIQRLLPIVSEGSDRYYELVAALQAARSALDGLLVSQALSITPTATIDGMDQGDWARGQEALKAEAAQLSGDLTNIAASFPMALAEGIRSGDIEGALSNALGGAADFFLDLMLKSILGPITEQLTKSIAASMAAQQAGSAAAGAAGAAGALGALGPVGLILGGLAVVASLASASSQRKQVSERNTTAVKAAVSGAPSVTYNLSATVQVQPGASFGDPAWEARMRAFVEQVATDLQKRVPRIK